MGNQFDAKVLFHAFAWWARDERTGAYVEVEERAEGARWLLKEGNELQRGFSKSPQAARAKLRRMIDKLPPAERGEVKS